MQHDVSIKVANKGGIKASLMNLMKDFNPLYCHMISYIFTGVTYNIINQTMSYQGLSEESTLILPFTTYLGMAGVIILPEHFFGESTSTRPNPNPKLPPSSSSQPPSPTHSPQKNLDPELTGVISTTTTTTTSPNNTQHRHLRTLSVENSSHSTQSLIHRQRKEKKKTAAQLPPFCLRLGTKVRFR